MTPPGPQHMHAAAERAPEIAEAKARLADQLAERMAAVPKPIIGKRGHHTPEETLQRSVVKLLRHALPEGSIFFAVPNGGLRSRTEAIRFKSTGTLAGVPDLLVITAGRILGIELKSGNGRLSDAQLYCHEQFRRAGADVFVCRSLEEVADALTAAGVPLRARVTA